MPQCPCCSDDCLRKLCTQQIPIFSSLDKEEMSRLASIARHRTHQKGETILSEGEAVDALIILSQGSAKAYKLTSDGREQILYIFAQGDFFGERNLLGGRKSAYTVETLESARTCAFGREDFNDLLRSSPEIAIKIIHELEKRLERMEDTMHTMGVRSLDGRIGSMLLDFGEKYGEQTADGTLVRLPLSREGIANFLGIARETVSRKLGQLEGDGIIRSVGNKAILLRDSGALRELAGKAE